MFSQLLQELRAMNHAERLSRLSVVLRSPWQPEELGHLGHIWAWTLWKLNRFSEAVAAVNDFLARQITDQFRARLLEVRGLIEVEHGDGDGALRTADLMDRYGVDDHIRPEYLGIRARALALQGDRECFAWFRQAVEAFQAAGRPDDAVAIATWAATFSLDTGLPVGEWLGQLPERYAYRLAVEADVCATVGDTDAAERLAMTAYDAVGADVHSRARARFAQARAVHSRNPDRAARLVEEALSLASSDRRGYEPLLVNRILEFRRMCGKEAG